MKERTTVRLPRDLLNRAKRKAAAEGRTLMSVIADGLRMALTGDNRRPTRAKRSLPPISKASGGLLLGVDLTTDSRPLQESDDIGCIRRLMGSI